MHHQANRGTDRQADTIDNGVRGAEGFNFKGEESNFPARLHFNHRNPVVQLKLFQFVAQQAESQPGAVDVRFAESLPEKGDGADVILVTVSQKQADDIFSAFLKRRNVRQDQINPQHIGFRKHQSAVDQQDLVGIFQSHHVQADFTESAESDDAQFVSW